MTRDPHSIPASLFTQVQISAGGQEQSADGLAERFDRGEQMQLLRDILSAQDRQNELLEELVSLLGQQQRQRAAELNQWKQANPRLAHNCRLAAEALSRVQSEFLETLTMEAVDNADALMDGEFMLTEFVDRFGPRLAHLNGVLQFLSHLAAQPNNANST